MQTRTRQITTSVRIATWTNTARPRIPSIAAAMSPMIACRSLLIQRVARMERSEMRDSRITLRSIRATSALIQTTEELNDAAERGGGACKQQGKYTRGGANRRRAQ